MEEFDEYYGGPHQYSADIESQKGELVTWINNGGVLLTHDCMFRGCEAETIVFLSLLWGRARADQPEQSVSFALLPVIIISNQRRSNNISLLLM